MIGVAGVGCATKGFVRESVGDVNTKVEALGQSIEATQQADQRERHPYRAGRPESRTGRIRRPDRADLCHRSAHAADAAAARAAAVETSVKRLIFQVVISDDQGNFEPGKADLPDDVRAKLDELATKLKADQAGNYIEIEGHTDSSGTPATNDRLGLARAENVKRYLYETYQIPLHKMNVISFGESKPVAPNDSREGRAQNRRVVIKVLS